jgi:hypothetical protein
VQPPCTSAPPTHPHSVYLIRKEDGRAREWMAVRRSAQDETRECAATQQAHLSRISHSRHTSITAGIPQSQRAHLSHQAQLSHSRHSCHSRQTPVTAGTLLSQQAHFNNSRHTSVTSGTPQSHQAQLCYSRHSSHTQQASRACPSTGGQTPFGHTD